ncbi:hypothetical protein H920_12220 [Fukomys damarensis]|uniref:Uncharacterized protein n=1 Tax=Fukomys damarensis TaxID=885580 RepID=A0A091D7F9_FUKDA|nr:hypothetical protein H920_12220 [Fukomys damarensis]
MWEGMGPEGNKTGQLQVDSILTNAKAVLTGKKAPHCSGYSEKGGGKEEEEEEKEKDAEEEEEEEEDEEDKRKAI